MPDLARDQLLTRLRELRPVFERSGVKHMALFGSRARGDHRQDSDVDLMIEVDDGRDFSLLKLVGVGHVVEDYLGLPANIFMRRSLNESFVRETSADVLEVF